MSSVCCNDNLYNIIIKIQTKLTFLLRTYLVVLYLYYKTDTIRPSCYSAQSDWESPSPWFKRGLQKPFARASDSIASV